MLEDEVEPKYYIKGEKVRKLISDLVLSGKLLIKQASKQACDLTTNNPRIVERANCIKARYDAGITNLQADGTGVVEVTRE